MFRKGHIRRRSADRPRRSIFVRILRAILFAIFFAFLFGFVVGMFLRRELDRPVRYMGELPAEAAEMLSRVNPRADSTLVDRPTDPGDVRYALPCVLVARDYEEQIG